ncbi:MAG: type II secretion system protein [Patescibacteria group bacterium]
MIAKKGFTLIELLIVIGILAILATTVVLVLNPAQILQESRDTQRISDLGSVQSAVGLLLATASTTVTFTPGPFCTLGIVSGFSGGACTTPLANVLRTVGGSGWLAVDLNGTSGGSTLSTLPIDPTNTGNYYFAYAGNNSAKTFELNARLESEKHRALMQNDGGDDNTCTGTFVDATCWYEIGTDPGLNL